MYKIILLNVILSSMIIASDGALDPSFGPNDDGKVTFNFKDPQLNDLSLAVVVRYDGLIVAGGGCSAVSGGGSGFAIVGFSPEGVATLSTCMLPLAADSKDRIIGLAVQPDNKLVAVGTSDNKSFTILRFNADFTLDTNFGTNGIVTVPFPPSGGHITQAAAVALTRNGRIVAVGQAVNTQDANSFYAVAVLNQDGSFDTDFAGTGSRIYATDFIPQNSFSSAADAVAIQSIANEEKIIMGGYGITEGGNLHFQIVRINFDGDLDTTFGTNSDGVEQVTFHPNSDNELANGVDIKPDGRIVAVGSSILSGIAQIALVQLTADGTPDTTFGPNADGKVLFPDPSAGESFNADAISIQNDQKILVAGSVAAGLSQSFLLARFNENGSIDSASFNPPTGYVVTQIEAISAAHAIALQTDGKIILSGLSGLSPTSIAVARYLNANNLDQVFVRPTIHSQDAHVPQPTFAGAAQNPSNITVYIDGVEIGRTITQEIINAWEFTPSVPLEPGRYIIQVVAEYQSGNQNSIAGPFCYGVTVGPQSCLTVAIREKYCPCG